MPETEAIPVEMVFVGSECQIFCGDAEPSGEKETGWVYRVPKEAEWSTPAGAAPDAGKAWNSAFDFYFRQARRTTLFAENRRIFEHSKD